MTQSKLKPLGDALLKLSPKVGFNPDDLATSLYHVESAFASTGISAQKAIDIVTQAAKLAKIGNADLGDTTQAIIGVLASGIKGVKDATDAAAQLNQLVGSGDTTLSAVDKAIATGILPTSQALGLSFKDVAAAIATLTDNATPADEAATRLRTTFSLIEKPTKGAIGALSSIGLSSVTLAEDMRKPDGLLAALTDLRTHLEKTYPSSRSTKLTTDEIAASTKSYTEQLLAQGVQAKTATDLGNKYAESLKNGGSAATQQAQTILAAFGGAKSGSTFLTLYEEFARYESKVKEFGTSAQAAAKFQSAWAQQQKTAKQKLDDLKASWDVFLIKVGNAILPSLKKIVDALARHPGAIKVAAAAVALLAAAWTISKFASAFSVIAKLTTAILGIGAASTTAAAESAAANVGGAAASAAHAGVAGVAGKGAAAAEGAAAAGAGGAPAAGEGGLIARLLGGGVSLGPIAVGIAGIAGGIHEIITDGQVKNLPALDKLAELIQGGGLKGKGPALDVGLALSTAKTGNNRGENIQDYLTRTLGTDVAAKNGLSYQKFFKIIQTGTRGDLEGFIAAYRSVEFQLKGSPNTISRVDDYLTALFNRYNSARVAAGQLTVKQREQSRQNYLAALSASYLSTNVAALSKTYGVNGKVAQQIAKSNADYKSELKGTVDAMTGYGVTLDKNSAAGKENINQVEVQIDLAKIHSQQVLRLTGNQNLANATLRSESIAFEQAAVKAGFNKDQIDALIRSFGGLPKDPQVDLKINGAVLALDQINNLWYALQRVQGQHEVDVSVIQTGSAPAALIAQAATSSQHGLGASAHAAGGIASGWSWVGERGPELMHVGSPSAVLSHHDSLAAIGPSGGGVTVNLTVQALDPKSVTAPMRQQWARETAIEIARAQKNGYKLN